MSRAISRSSISRSVGISPGVPWAGPLPGGGYQGKTRKLDLTVERAAKLLAKAFGRDVEIRFNSHRESGGAFVKHGGKTWTDQNSAVGITVTLTRPGHRRYDTANPRRLLIEASIWAGCLRDRAIVTQPGCPWNGDGPTWGPSARREFRTNRAAIAWLKKNVIAENIPQ